jgi:hypothetical protein
MSLVARTPVIFKGDNKLKFLSFVTIGLLATFFVILIYLPGVAINAATQTGKQIAKYSKKIIGTTITQTGKVLSLTGDAISNIKNGAVSAISTMSSKVAITIEYFINLLREVPQLVGGLARMVSSSMTDLIKLIFSATKTFMSAVGNFSKEAIQVVRSSMKEVVNMFTDTVESLSRLVDEVFVPTIRRVMKIPADLARTIADKTKRFIPYIKDGVKMIMKSAVGHILKDCQETTTVLMTIIQFSKNVEEFAKALTGGDVFDIISTAMRLYVGNASVRPGQILTPCNIITNLVNIVLNFIPLPGFIRECQTEIIQAGVNWMTRQKFCKTRPRNRVYLRAALCFFEQIGDLTLIPAFELDIGPLMTIKAIAKFPYIPDPLKWVADEFLNILDRLPSITFGWQDLSIRTMLNAVANVFATALELIGLVVFHPALGLQLNFTGNPLKDNPIISMQIGVLKMMTFLMSRLIPLLFDQFKTLASRVFNMIKKWDVCTPRFCIDLYFDEICAPRICVSSVVGSLSFLLDFIMGFALNEIQKLITVTDAIFRMFGVGDTSDFEGLDEKLMEAFQRLVVKLPFYLRFSGGSLF